VQQATLSLDSDLSQLMFSELNFRYNAVVGGCDGLATFLKSRTMNRALTMQRVVSVNITTIKAFDDYYEKLDRVSDIVSCSNASLASAIIHRLADYSTSEPFSATCGGRLWNIDNCGSETPSVCIDCVDPCREHCSNARYINYLSSCMTDEFRVCTALGRRSGIPDSIHLLSVYVTDRVPAPAILAFTMNATQYTLSATVWLAGPGGVQCGLFASGLAPTSLDEVRAQGVVSYSEPQLTSVGIQVTELHASTNYSLYCFSISSSGAHMSLAEMQRTGVQSFSTDCCKTLTATLQSSFVYTNNNYRNVLTLALDAPPSSGVLAVDVTLRVGATEHTAFYPRTVTFSANATAALAVDVSFLSSSVPAGVYNVIVQLRGPFTNEYSVIYAPGSDKLTALGADAPLPVPKLLSAQFSSAGDSVTVTFDSASDRAGTTVFTCSILLQFTQSAQSKCRWADSATVVIYPHTPLSSAVTYSGLLEYNNLQQPVALVVGGTVRLLSGVLRAECESAGSSCSIRQYASTAVVTAVAPNAALTPIVSISAPSVVGVCDSLMLDLSGSSGSGGRPWTQVTVTVRSPTASDANIQQLESFLLLNYTLLPPVAIPAALLSPLTDYSFLIRMCNYLGACGTAVHSVTVLNTTNPYVTIIGSSTRYMSRSAPLQIDGEAFMMRVCGDEPSKENLKFSWSVIRDGLAEDRSVSQSRNPLRFTLPAYSLQSSTLYYIYFTALDTVTGYSASTSVKVQVTSNTIVAVIDGANARTMNVGDSLRLEGMHSYSEDTIVSTDNSRTSIGLTHKWSCVQVYPNVTSACNLGLTAIAKSSTAIRVVSGSVGSVSDVTLTVTDAHGVSGSTTMTVSVIAATVPRVDVMLSVPNAVYSSAHNAYLLNAHQQLKIVAQIDLTKVAPLKSLTSLSAGWHVEGDDGLDLSTQLLTPVVIDLLPYKQNSVLKVAFSLALQENALLSAVRYTFSLHVRDQVTSVSVLVNSAPLPGGLIVSPTTGTSMSTVFTLSAQQWQDLELPLTHSFGFIGADDARVVLSGRSEQAYLHSVLPAIVGGVESSSLTLSLLVYDSLDAVAEATATVTIAAVSAINDDFSDRRRLTALLTDSTENVIDINLYKRMLGLQLALLNAVNCSLAPDCAGLYNRQRCDTTANTCGACEVGYIGVDGDSNSLCSAVSDGMATTSVARQMSFIPSLCAHNDDCSGLFEQCVDNVCIMSNATCTAGCSDHGLCIMRNKYTGDVVTACTIGDMFCSAECQCNDGYHGSDCQLSDTELSLRATARTMLIETFVNLTTMEDITTETVASWVSIVNALSLTPTELTLDSAVTLMSALNAVLYASSLTTLPYNQLLPLLSAMNSIVQFQRMNDINHANATQSIALADSLIASCVERLQIDMTDGQSAVTFAGSEIRIAIYAQRVYSAAMSEHHAVALPITASETHLGNHANSVSVPAMYSNAVDGDVLVVTAYSLNSRLTNTTQLNSNPLYIHLRSSNDVNSLRIDCTGNNHTNCEIQVVLQYNRHVYHIPPFEEVTRTQCYDRDYFIQNYSCLTYDGRRSLSCPGVPGYYYDRCDIINVTSACSNLAMAPINGGNYSSCRVEQFTNYNVTCACRVDKDAIVSDNRRRLSSGTDVTSFTSLSLACGSVEVVYNTTYDRYFAENNHESVLVHSTIVLYGMCILGGMVSLFVCGLFGYERRDTVSKAVNKSFGKKKTAPVNDIDNNDNINNNSMKRNKPGFVDLDRVYMFSNDENDDDITPDYNQQIINNSYGGYGGGGEEHKSQDFYGSNNHKYEITVSGGDNALRPFEASRITPAAALAVIPEFFHPLLEGYTLWDKALREMFAYHRWLSLITHESKQYSKWYRLCAVLSQLTCPLFLLATILYLTDPHDSSCKQYLDERSCIRQPSQYIAHNSQCLWLLSSHTCHYRQPQESVQRVILVTMVAALLSVPFARFSQCLLVKIALPSALPVDQTAAPLPAPVEQSKANWLSPEKSRPLKQSSVSPMKQGHRGHAHHEEDLYPHTPLQLKQTHFFGSSPAKPHKVGCRQFSAAQYRCYSFINTLSVPAEVELLAFHIRNYAEALIYLGNFDQRLHLLGL
jgi:hypothetical protein